MRPVPGSKDDVRSGPSSGDRFNVAILQHWANAIPARLGKSQHRNIALISAPRHQTLTDIRSSTRVITCQRCAADCAMTTAMAFAVSDSVGWGGRVCSRSVVLRRSLHARARTGSSGRSSVSA